MPLSSDLQTGVIAGRVQDAQTGDLVAVRVEIRPDFVVLADLPGGADSGDPGAIVVDFPTITIADSTVVHTGSGMWSYTCPGDGSFSVTLLATSGGATNPADPTYTVTVWRVGETTPAVGPVSVNIVAGQTLPLSALPPNVRPLALRAVVSITGGSAFPGTVTASQISDATADARALLLGTLTAPQQAALRTLLGAGTSSLAVGPSATDAKPGDWAPTAAQVSDSTAVGRQVLTAADAAAARTAIGAIGAADLPAPDTTSVRAVVETAGVWPPRPVYAGPVLWSGPDFPGAGTTTSGTGMVEGLDIWLT